MVRSRDRDTMATMTKFRCTLAVLVALALSGCRRDSIESAATADEVRVSLATVILVRHGEKATDDPRDPSLSPAGEARARALAAMLAKAGVTHLFATQYRRTQATISPLASATGLTPTLLPA